MPSTDITSLNPRNRGFGTPPVGPKSSCIFRSEAIDVPHGDLFPYGGSIPILPPGFGLLVVRRDPSGEAPRDADNIPEPPRNRQNRGRAGGLLRLVVAAWTYWRREYAVSRSIAAFSALDDRTLSDLGIHDRYQIPWVIRHGRSSE